MDVGKGAGPRVATDDEHKVERRKKEQYLVTKTENNNGEYHSKRQAGSRDEHIK